MISGGNLKNGSDEQEQEQEHEQAAVQPNADLTPASVGIQNAHKPENSECPLQEGVAQSQAKPTPFDRDLAQTDRTIKWFTVVSGTAAAVSAIAALYTASQISTSSRQVDNAIANIASAAGAAQREADVLGEQVGEMRTQTAALETNAQAAQGQLRVTKDIERRQFRSYVLVEPMPINDLVVGSSPTWGIKTVVIGQSPVTKAQTALFIALTQYPNQSALAAFAKSQMGSTSDANTLFPNGDYSNSVTLPTRLTGEELARLNLNTDYRLILYGFVTYSDQFGEVHHTPFCYMRIGGPSPKTGAVCDPIIGRAD